MSGSVLVPGALVQHIDGRTGHLVDSVLGWAVKLHNGEGSLMWSGELNGWSLVGETGIRPEGTRLAWVSEETATDMRWLVDCEKGNPDPKRALSYAREFVRLNPEAQDTP